MLKPAYIAESFSLFCIIDFKSTSYILLAFLSRKNSLEKSKINLQHQIEVKYNTS